MHEGAYLYYDGNKGSFIRSGKVTRRGFTVRGKEHFDESKKEKSSTHFYDLYPSTCVQEPTKEAQKVHSKIFRRLLELFGIQPPIAQICWTKVGRMVVF